MKDNKPNKPNKQKRKKSGKQRFVKAVTWILLGIMLLSTALSALSFIL